MKKIDESAFKVSEFLLQIKAIKLNVAKPFNWASGWKSPIYCDNRKTLSYPKIRNYLRQQFVRIITDEYGIPEVIAGIATGGIAIGALVAQEMNLPFVYVRSDKKTHGLENVIEGVIEQGQTVVVIEDLISTGTSSIKSVEALNNAGCKVLGVAAIFTYNFKTAEENFKKAKCSLITLTNYNALMQQAFNNNYIIESEMIALERWRENPSQWGT